MKNEITITYRKEYKHDQIGMCEENIYMRKYTHVIYVIHVEHAFSLREFLLTGN